MGPSNGSDRSPRGLGGLQVPSCDCRFGQRVIDFQLDSFQYIGDDLRQKCAVSVL